jgi:hypothetical protein
MFPASASGPRIRYIAPVITCPLLMEDLIRFNTAAQSEGKTENSIDVTIIYRILNANLQYVP